MGGNKSAPCLGRGFGSHQNEFSRKRHGGTSLRGARGAHLPAWLLARGRSWGGRRKVSGGVSPSLATLGADHTSPRPGWAGAWAGFALAPLVVTQTRKANYEWKMNL